MRLLQVSSVTVPSVGGVLVFFPLVPCDTIAQGALGERSHNIDTSIENRHAHVCTHRSQGQLVPPPSSGHALWKRQC